MFKQTLGIIFTNKTITVSTFWFLLSSAGNILLAAFITKQLGLIVPVAIIALYRTAEGGSGLLQPYLKKFTFKQVSLLVNSIIPPPP